MTTEPEFLPIIRHPAFQRLAMLIRIPATSIAYRGHHPAIAWRFLLEQARRTSRIADGSPEAFTAALQKLAVAMQRTSPRLVPPAADWAWLEALFAEQPGIRGAVASLLLAYGYARDQLVTPAQLEEAGHGAQVTWRGRAARGEVPGAMNLGRQWMLPAGVLQALYGIERLPERENEADYLQASARAAEAVVAEYRRMGLHQLDEPSIQHASHQAASGWLAQMGYQQPDLADEAVAALYESYAAAWADAYTAAWAADELSVLDV